MTTTNLILRIEGDIPLELYAQVVGDFAALVKELGTAVTGNKRLPWEIVGLTYGSAELVADVLDETPDVIEQANEVVRAYEQIGFSLAEGEDIPFTSAVGVHARALIGVINGQITSIIFATANQKIEVSAPATALVKHPHASWVWGSIRGELGSVSKRPRNQVTIYDSLFDRAVNCYMPDTTIINIDELWKSNRVEVVGKVHYSDKGRPLKVTDVISVTPLLTHEAFRQARNVLPWATNEMPETIIRRLRDGE